MKVNYLNFTEQWQEDKKKLLPIIDKVFNSGEYVGAHCLELLKLKKNLNFFFKRYVVPLNSGTDALVMALHAIGVRRGHEVITTSNSYIASAGSIVHLGAKPIFVDVLPDQNMDVNKLESLITKNTKAIMPVHLTGRSCDMEKIMKVAKKYKLSVVEDCAQAFGSRFNGKLCGTFGSFGCFSTHPLKNFNAMGDGGFIITDNKKFANYISKLSNHGLKTRDECDSFGFNSRLDNIQATILNFRLNKMNKIIKRRRENAKYYLKHLDKRYIFSVPEKKEEFNTYHTFVIQVPDRNKLQNYLKKKNIIAYVHYPFPIHKQKKLKKRLGEHYLPITELQSKKILSIPIHHSLTKKQLKYTVDSINSFYK